MIHCIITFHDSLVIMVYTHSYDLDKICTKTRLEGMVVNFGNMLLFAKNKFSKINITLMILQSISTYPQLGATEKHFPPQIPPLQLFL